MANGDLLKAILELKKALESIKGIGDSANEGSKAVMNALKNVETSAKSAVEGVDAVGNSLETFSKASITNTQTLGQMVNVLRSVDSAVASFAASGNGLAKMAGLDFATAPFLNSIKLVSSAMETASKAVSEVAQLYDSVDAGTRELTKTQYGLVAGLGLGFDSAVKNVDAFQDLLKVNSDFSRQGFYFSKEEFLNGISAMQRAGISMEELGRASGVAAGGLNNMQAMTMQAKAMGMDIGEYSSKISNMVRKNGLSIEDSMKLMASSQTIAGETGLRVDEVTASLESATSGFQKMGATMDFGRPILKGFAESVKDVGLGIAQAGDLASTFSQSLMGIVNNPALAYITSMKGGFGGGGNGGVLDASIQMQAMMLDQSPDSQAQLASNLSKGMAEVLKSYGGGNIVTVKEAAAGGAQEKVAFTAQQQMLGSMYGISDTMTQSRVLEYLDNLQKATAEGDEEQIAKINQQIVDAKNGTDKTMSIQDKISASMDKSVIIAQETLNLHKANFIAAGGESKILEKIGNITALSESLLGDPENADKQSKLNSANTSLNEMLGDLAKHAAGDKKAPDNTSAAAGGTQMGAAQVGNANTTGAQSQQGAPVIVTTNLYGVEATADVKVNGVSASPGTVKFSRQPVGSA